MSSEKKKHKLNFKATAAMACTMVLVLAVAINASAGRISFFETAKTIWEDSFIYSYITKESNELKPKEPGYIPAGYKILAQDADTVAASFIYQTTLANRSYVCSIRSMMEVKLYLIRNMI